MWGMAGRENENERRKKEKNAWTDREKTKGIQK
jgi:hypothetical protein